MLSCFARALLSAVCLGALSAPTLAQDDALTAQVQEFVRGKRIWLRETSPPESERPRVAGEQVLHPRTDEALRVLVLRRGDPAGGPRVVALFSAADQAFWTVAWRRGEDPVPGIVNGPYALPSARTVERRDVEQALRALIPSDGDIGHFDGMFERVAALGAGAVPHLAAIARDEAMEDRMRVLAVEALGESAGAGDLGVLRELAGAELLPQDSLSQAAIYALAKLGDRTRLDQQIPYLREQLQRVKRENPQHPLLGRLCSELAIRYLRTDAYDDAIRCYHDAVRASPTERGINLYNLACAFALKGDTDRALDALEQSVREGYRGFAWMLRDGDLKSLRELPRFKKLLEGRTKKEY